MMPIRLESRPGFVFLISVLAVGVIAAATAASLLLLGGAAEHTAFSAERSLQALEYARACAERAMLSLRRDLGYAGDERFTWDRGSCILFTIGGSGNEQRAICAEGRSGGAARRVRVDIARLFPNVLITSWREVPSFSSCGEPSP